MLSPQPFLLSELLWEAAREVGDRPAIVAGAETVTYEQLLEQASRVAHLLHLRGLEPGDRVVVYMENCPLTAAAIFGVSLAGGVFTVINHQAKSERLRAVIEDCGARKMICDGRLAHVFEPAVEGLEIDVLRSREDGAVGARIEPALEDVARDVPKARVMQHDLAALIYTSGSTGVPKGVMMSHQAMRFTAETIVRYLEQRRAQKVISVLPLSFTYGLYQLLAAVRVGATLVLEKSFAYPGQIVKRFREVEPQVFAGVPTIYQTLIRLDRKTPIELPSVETLTNAAAALPTPAIEHIRRIFPNAKLYKMYGLTEATRVCYLDPAKLDDKPDSVGRAIPGTEIFLHDADGNPVPPGEIGVLHIRGPNVMLGYWGRPEASANMLLPGKLPFDRVLRTGDWFKQDEDGDLYFVARSDDVIKTRGEKVSPVEVERVIYALEGVADAAVIGVPDETQGQKVRAYVQLVEGAELDERRIRMHCAAHLEPYMVPTEVWFEDSLPKTASGKILKQALKDRDQAPSP